MAYLAWGGDGTAGLTWRTERQHCININTYSWSSIIQPMVKYTKTKAICSCCSAYRTLSLPNLKWGTLAQCDPWSLLMVLMVSLLQNHSFHNSSVPPVMQSPSFSAPMMFITVQGKLYLVVGTSFYCVCMLPGSPYHLIFISSLPLQCSIGSCVLADWLENYQNCSCSPGS
jgi:hypothetical protein